MSDEKIVTEDLVNSLTGFDEVAITRAFGAPLDALTGSLTMRALAFVADKRAGAKDVDAYRAVMGCPVADIADRFAVDIDEVDASGKAGTPETGPH
jgi:hypothetical protein